MDSIGKIVYIRWQVLQQLQLPRLRQHIDDRLDRLENHGIHRCGIVAKRHERLIGERQNFPQINIRVGIGLQFLEDLQGVLDEHAHIHGVVRAVADRPMEQIEHRAEHLARRR